MIYSEKEKRPVFNVHFQYSQSKITGLNMMRSLKSLVMLKCESRNACSTTYLTARLCSDVLFLLF